MPEWASFLVGLSGGVVVAVIGTYYGEWLRDRRANRKLGRQLVARLRGLLDDAKPGPLTLATLKEHHQRHGERLLREWKRLRVPLREFGLESSREIREAVHDTANVVTVALWTRRDAADALDADERRQAVRAAEERYAEACESVDRLERVVTRRSASSGGRTRA